MDKNTHEVTTPDGEIVRADIHTKPLPTVFLRTPYNYDRDYASEASGLYCPEPTLTQQSFKDECDINVILERFGITGELPSNVRTPLNEDFVGITDYHQAVNLLKEADAAFMQMPANVRARFNNDAGEFIEWAEKKENLKEARELGLALPEPTEPTPQLVKIVQDDNPSNANAPTASGSAPSGASK